MISIAAAVIFSLCVGGEVHAMQESHCRELAGLVKGFYKILNEASDVDTYSNKKPKNIYSIYSQACSKRETEFNAQIDALLELKSPKSMDILEEIGNEFLCDIYKRFDSIKALIDDIVSIEKRIAEFAEFSDSSDRIDEQALKAERRKQERFRKKVGELQTKFQTLIKLMRAESASGF